MRWNPLEYRLYIHGSCTSWNLGTFFCVITLIFNISNLTGSPCTDARHTCNVTTQFCNETHNGPGFVCTCINDTEQLSAQNRCVPIPESQRLFLTTTVDISSVTKSVWSDFNMQENRQKALLSAFPPGQVFRMKTGTFIDMIRAAGDRRRGMVVLRYSLLFDVNVTTHIKASVARRVLELEREKFLMFQGEKITFSGNMGIFDTRDQMSNHPATDSVDWCSWPNLFSCRNHSTCRDYGLRYTCPCNVGYYDNTECFLPVRLAGVQGQLEGRLEYNTGGAWQTVCQRGFTTRAAEVACRQLGLPARGAVYFENAMYGQGTGDVYSLVLNCTGRELALSQCPTQPLAPGSCDHTMDVGIRCDKACLDDYHYGVTCSQPCQCNMSNTETCDRLNGTCYCKAGWEGVTCDDDVDECALSSPCTGELPRCQNTAGGFQCLCVDSAQKNDLGICVGEDSTLRTVSPPPTDFWTRLIIVVAASCAGGVVLVIIAVIIGMVVVKIKAQTYSQATGAATRAIDYSDLNSSASSSIHDDPDTCEEIQDETAHPVWTSALATLGDTSDGSYSLLRDIARERTAPDLKESSEATRAYYSSVNRKGNQKGRYVNDNPCLGACDKMSRLSLQASTSGIPLVDIDTYLDRDCTVHDSNMTSVLARSPDEAVDNADTDNCLAPGCRQSSVDGGFSESASEKSERDVYLHPVFSAGDVG